MFWPMTAIFRESLVCKVMYFDTNIVKDVHR